MRTASSPPRSALSRSSLRIGGRSETCVAARPAMDSPSVVPGCGRATVAPRAGTGIVWRVPQRDTAATNGATCRRPGARCWRSSRARCGGGYRTYGAPPSGHRCSRGEDDGSGTPAEDPPPSLGVLGSLFEQDCRLWLEEANSLQEFFVFGDQGRAGRPIEKPRDAPRWRRSLTGQATCPARIKASTNAT